MPNPLFNALNGQQANPMAQLVQDARRLRQTFNGDPKQAVQNLLSSGQMSQNQFNQYAQIAQQVIGTGVFR